MSDMKRLLAIMAEPNSLGDPSLVNEDYDGAQHGEMNVCGGRECELIGMVGDNYRVRYSDGSTGTVDPSDCEGANSRIVDESAEAEGDDDLYADFEELVGEMHEMIGKLEQIVSRLPRGLRGSAQAYWLGHIKAAVDSSDYGYGGYDTDMAKTLEELYNYKDGDDEEDEDIDEDA